MACRMQERSYHTRHSQFPRGKSGQTPLQPVMLKTRRSQRVPLKGLTEFRGPYVSLRLRARNRKRMRSGQGKRPRLVRTTPFVK